MRKQIFIWLFLAGLMLQSAASVSLAQEKTLSATMQKGIGQFKHENYDEALVTFQLACKEEPNSSFNSYYLGLTYKKLQDYKAAIEPLKAAVTNEPKIGQALIELIDCLYQLNELDEAKTWIAEAEKEFVHPAQAAFLKGLVLLKADDNDGAIKAFTDAKTLDKGMEQSCDYQIGIAYMKKKQFVDAKKIFKDTIVFNPASNIGGFARQYLDALARREELAKPFKFDFGFAWQYDDNVNLKPDDTTITTNISGKSDSREVYTAVAEYNHNFSDFFSLRSVFSSYYAMQNHLTFYDMSNNNFIIQPNLNFKDSMLSFPVGYNYVFVDSRAYLSAASASSVYNRMVGKVNMGQLSFSFQNQNYRWSPSINDENRDGNNYTGSFGWYFFFAKNQGFLNARYSFNKDQADGNDWDHEGNRATITALIPVFSKLNLTLAADSYRQRFLNTNTVYGLKRADTVYTFSALLAYKIFKDSQFQITYTRIKDDSNINVYQYLRNIYGVGFDFKF